jgi:glycosyl transferase family 87
MRWREATVAIAAIFLLSRLVVVLVAVFLENNVPLAYQGPSYSAAPILQSLTGVDSIYLLGIAAEGYHDAPVREAFRDWAFFPLYPILTRLFSIFTLGDVGIAGVLVANLAFVAALAVLYRLTVIYLDHDRAVRSLAFVAFAPGAVAFAMAYTDSLFLLLAAGAFLAIEWRRWWLMGLLYGLATLTRLPGILLGIPLAIAIAEASGGWRSVAGWRTPRMLWLAAGPIGFALFAAYLGWAFGDPLGMFTAQQAWSNIGRPETGNTTPVVDRFDPLVLLLVGVLILYLFLFVFRRADRPPAWATAFALVTVVTALASGRLQSIGRYLAVAWPFDWTLANRRAAWFQLTGLAIFGALFAIHAMLHFTQALAP